LSMNWLHTRRPTFAVPFVSINSALTDRADYPLATVRSSPSIGHCGRSGTDDGFNFHLR
jgi:hypothetical protein